VRVPPHTAQAAKALSFALGKRFAVAKLTASLSARTKLRPRLLVASGRLIPSPEIQVSTGKDLLIPRGRAGLEASYLSPISPPFSNTLCRFAKHRLDKKRCGKRSLPSFSWVSLRFLDHLLPNAVPSRFLVPIGFTLFTGRPNGSKKRRSCAILR
jgi:hypothetical protein